MIGDKTSALSSEVRIFFKNPAAQVPKDHDHPPASHKRQQGKPAAFQASPIKPAAFPECSKEPDSLIDDEPTD